MRIDRKALAAALKRLQPAMGRSTVPILECAMLAARDGKARVLKTDMDRWIEVSLDGEGDLGPVCPNAAMLASAVGACSGETVEIEERPSGLVLRHARGRATLPLIDPIEFPAAPELAEDAATVAVDGAALAEALKRVGHAVSTEQTRYYLCGVHLASRPGRLQLSATDGHRLARTFVEAEGAAGDAILPAATVSALAGIEAGSGASRVTLAVSDRLIRIEASGLVIVSRLIDAAYPDMDRVIPSGTSWRCSAEMTAADLAQAVQAVQWAASEEAATPVMIRISPGEEALARSGTNGTKGRSVATLPCTADAAAEVCLNGRYLLDLCRAVGDGRVTMRLASELAPVRFDVADRPDDAHVIMPMRGAAWPAEDDDA